MSMRLGHRSERLVVGSGEDHGRLIGFSLSTRSCHRFHAQEGPPEDVATRVGPRAKRVEFYALMSWPDRDRCEDAVRTSVVYAESPRDQTTGLSAASGYPTAPIERRVAAGERYDRRPEG